MEDDLPKNVTPLRRPVRPVQQNEPEKKLRISKIMGALLVIFAISIDLIEMLLEWLGIGILGISTLLSVGTAVIFWIWFKMLGVSFATSPKRFATMALTSVAEIIPGLDAIGGFLWTIGIILLVVMTRSEDKGGVLGKVANTATSAMKGKLNNVIPFEKTRKFSPPKSSSNVPAKEETEVLANKKAA
jgi:hypothetical protein